MILLLTSREKMTTGLPTSASPSFQKEQQENTTQTTTHPQSTQLLLKDPDLQGFKSKNPSIQTESSPLTDLVPLSKSNHLELDGQHAILNAACSKYLDRERDILCSEARIWTDLVLVQNTVELDFEERCLVAISCATKSCFKPTKLCNDIISSHPLAIKEIQKIHQEIVDEEETQIFKKNAEKFIQDPFGLSQISFWLGVVIYAIGIAIFGSLILWCFCVWICDCIKDWAGHWIGN